jgi:hypothetical protein
MRARFFLARAVIFRGSSPASTKAARIFPFPWPALGVDSAFAFAFAVALASGRGARRALRPAWCI